MMKKRMLSVVLALCMALMLVPQAVFAAETPYDLLIGNAYFTSSKKTLTVGSGTATFDPNNAKLTLKNITVSYNMASAAAIESAIPNLTIELSGTNTINIQTDKMCGLYMYGGSKATITGTSGSKLIINSVGKENLGITTDEGVSLTLTNTNLTVNDNTTTASAKGYMVGIKPGGDLTMSGGSYTAKGVQEGIEMYTNCAANLSGVSFNISCTPRQSFDSTIPNEMSIGVNLAPVTSKQNVITNCSGSISAHYPLYVEGTTALNTANNLTLTTDNYAAVYVTANLTVSGGTLNLASTGSSGSGFYVLKSYKLVFNSSPKVTMNVGGVAIHLSGDGASAEINGGTLKTTAKAGVYLSKAGNTFTFTNGTLDMTPKTGETQAIGIQSYGTVSITGGSLKTSAGMYSAIQNAGTKSFGFSGGTHTLSSSQSTGSGYIDTANGTLNISGTADVTFDGWSDGMDVLGTLNLSGGKLTVRNTASDAIYTTGTLRLTGGTLKTGNVRVGVLVGDGGTVNFAGTDATLVGSAAGWGKTSGTGAYSVTGGKVVLQGGSYAASTIYSSLAQGYSVYAGSNESNAVRISNPSGYTFIENTYVRIEKSATYTLTLVNVEGATSASHAAGADISYTAAAAPDNQHFAYWEMKVGDGAAVKVGTNPTYTGKMPDGNATLTAVYEYCTGGQATCQSKAKCSVCGKEYGILGVHILTAEVEDPKYEITPATCEGEGCYYKSCTVCGASAKNWNNATFTVPALGHTGGTATCQELAECSVCHEPYGKLASHNYSEQAKTAEALKTPGTCQDNAVYYYSCSVCGKVEHKDNHTFEGDKDPNNHVGCTSVSGTVTGFESGDSVTVQLIENGASEPAYETTVNSDNATYTIHDVAPGTYTLRVTKNGLITREYAITVGTENIVRDIALYPLGDITCDGSVTGKDVVMLRQYLAETITLNEQQFANADVNGDGSVTGKDLVMLRQYVAEIIPSLG